MNGRDSMQFWSVSLGTWFGTQVRVSIYLPVLFAVICIRLGLENLKIGLAFSAVYFLAVLIHEFAHIFAVRLTGGSGHEILIWPLGGLASVQPTETFRSQFLTPAAGPLINLMVCAATFWWVWTSGYISDAMNPLVIPQVELASSLVVDLVVLTFCANWILFLVNLLPVYPLDGGRMLHACLRSRLGSDVSLELAVRIGYFAAFLVMIAGLLVDSPMLVFLGAILVILNMMERIQSRPVDGYDDSFMGYDFSQGYTSLERNSETAPKTQRSGLIARWRERRRAEKLKQEQLQDEQDQRMLDLLLEKVHSHGMESLTDAERRNLHRASDRLRDRGKQGT